MEEESRILTDTASKWDRFQLTKKIKCSSGSSVTLQLKDMLPAKGKFSSGYSVSLSKKNKPPAVERKKQRQKKRHILKVKSSEIPEDVKLSLSTGKGQHRNQHTTYMANCNFIMRFTNKFSQKSLNGCKQFPVATNLGSIKREHWIICYIFSERPPWKGFSRFFWLFCHSFRLKAGVFTPPSKILSALPVQILAINNLS